MNEQFLRLQQVVLDSPLLPVLLDNWDKVALPDSWLVAGAIAQTVWNHEAGFPLAHGISDQTFGLPLTHGINDIDIVYFR